MDWKRQETPGNVTAHMSTSSNYSTHKSITQKGPYRIAAIIMVLVIFASAILPGWFVVSTQKKQYNGEDVQYDQQGIPYFVPSYMYRDHGNVVFSMLLASNNDHYTAECSPMVKSLSILTLAFFILSLLMYVTASQIQYSSFMINCSPMLSSALLILQAICFNQNNITVTCSDIIRTNYKVGIVWWICLILLLFLAIYNIVNNKKTLHVSLDNTANKNEQQKVVVIPRKLSPQIPSNSWCCGFCGHQNMLNSEFCESCGYEHIEEK